MAVAKRPVGADVPALRKLAGAPLARGDPKPSGCDCSVGIMAYNEEANIANAIHTVLGPPSSAQLINELVVVASGCTDRTAAVVADIARDDPRVRLIVQDHREGKASAINLFIAAAQSPVLLMVGADVLVRDGTIAALLQHFEDPTVGMVGGHPIPVNDETTFLGHADHVLWRLHHRLALQSPKLGEIVAFRNIVPSIPLDSAVDEISIQALITQLGYRLVYEPQGVVYNRGPTTLRDFLRQRRRIYAGHLRVRRQQGYAATTMSLRRVCRALIGSGCFSTPRAALWTVCTIALEAAARGLGHYDFMRRQPLHVWKTVATTKRHIAEGANAHNQQAVLVFQIVDFHHHQLELGVHTSRQLTQHVLQYIRAAIGFRDVVSVQRGGTIIALTTGDREEVEHRARQVVGGIEGMLVPANGHREGVSIKLAFGVIAFSWAEQTLGRSVPGREPDMTVEIDAVDSHALGDEWLEAAV